MDIQSRKLAIIEHILEMEDLTIMSAMEELLNVGNSELNTPLTKKEFEANIEESMQDYHAGKTKSAREMLDEMGE
ncbi:MAG: hypothetical protein NWR83_01060 [Salibacteraceae bacterium]|nr:hypothetical protein [Salibacteraceae bacterium]